MSRARLGINNVVKMLEITPIGPPLKKLPPPPGNNGPLPKLPKNPSLVGLPTLFILLLLILLLFPPVNPPIPKKFPTPYPGPGL